MQSELAYSQFEFTARQRQLLLPLAESAQAMLHTQRQEAADEERAFTYLLAPLDQLLGEVAKFTYHVADEQYRKISLSKPLLILLLFELMQRLSPNTYEPLPTHGVEQDEHLRLYYFLSFHFTYHFALAEYNHFFDQLRPAEAQARAHLFARTHINTAGMNEVAVFTALYNAAKPQGMGFLQDDPRNITEEEGAKFYYHRDPLDDFSEEEGSLPSIFDYVGGRLLKLSRSDIERGYIDVTTYDKYNGEGTAWRAVEHLPRT